MFNIKNVSYYVYYEVGKKGLFLNFIRENIVFSPLFVVKKGSEYTISVKYDIKCFIFFINSLSWQKMVKNHVSHAKVQANMTWVTTMCTFSPCTGSFDLFVRLFRKLSYRIIYWCVFPASSHHSESNEMRQAYVLSDSFGNSITLGYHDVTMAAILDSERMPMFWDVYLVSNLYLGSIEHISGVICCGKFCQAKSLTRSRISAWWTVDSQPSKFFSFTKENHMWHLKLEHKNMPLILSQVYVSAKSEWKYSKKYKLDKKDGTLSL